VDRPPGERSEIASEPFPCERCGAQVEYQPGTQHQGCPYCGHEAPIAAAGGEVAELALREYLDRAAAEAETAEARVSDCPSCGAQTTLAPELLADECAFCGTAIVWTGRSTRVIRPASLLPFGIARDAAVAAYRGWLRSLWFAPNALTRGRRRRDALKGVYIPFWTYDCTTESDYRGLRGDDYFVSVPYTTTVNGRTVTRTRRERRTRWTPVSGTSRGRFDDVLVLGSRTLPRRYVRELEPWDLGALVPFRDEYLSGFQAERYQLGLAEGLGVAKERMEPVIRSAVRGRIGGDRQVIRSLETRYADLTFKHILLPLWISAYRFKDRTYRFLVNARTGEVQGERPWSWVKITLASLAALAGIAALVALLAYLN